MLDISHVHAVNFKSMTYRSFYTFTVYTFLKQTDLEFGPASSFSLTDFTRLSLNV